MRHILLAGSAVFLLAAAPHRPPVGLPVPMISQPGSPLDQAARRLSAEDLADAADHQDKPLVLTGTAALGGERPALFVQLQSPRECGSAGCTTSVYMWTHGQWSRVLDGAPGRLVVAPTHTRGMADLLVNDERYVWSGSAYHSAHPAPQIDLHPHRPPPRRH